MGLLWWRESDWLLPIGFSSAIVVLYSLSSFFKASNILNILNLHLNQIEGPSQLPLTNNHWLVLWPHQMIVPETFCSYSPTFINFCSSRLLALTVDRFLYILKPLRYHQIVTPRRSLKTVVIIWTLIILHIILTGTFGK